MLKGWACRGGGIMKAVAMSVGSAFRLMGRWLLVVSTAFLLTSCSTRLVYNYLDWIIPWYVNDYVELNSDQKSYFKRQLRAVLKWHREEELPKYVTELSRLQSQLREPDIPAEQVQAFMYLSEEAWKRIVKRGMPYLGTLIRTFSNEQTQQLLTEIQASESKRREKLASRTVAQQYQRDVKNMQEALEQWVGPLQPNQQALVSRWAKQRPKSQMQWIEYRTFWRQGLVTTLENRRTSQFVPGFQSLMLEQEPYSGHPYRSNQLPRTLSYAANFLSDFHKTLTTEQRRFLNVKLDKLIQDFEYLHRAG